MSKKYSTYDEINKGVLAGDVSLNDIAKYGNLFQNELSDGITEIKMGMLMTLLSLAQTLGEQKALNNI